MLRWEYLKDGSHRVVKECPVCGEVFATGFYRPEEPEYEAGEAMVEGNCSAHIRQFHDDEED